LSSGLPVLLSQPSPTAVERRPSHLNSLTSIRFFAAAYVVAFHLNPEKGHPHGLFYRFLDHGYIAVSLFFILSGFILTRTYRERWTARKSFAPFLIARIARIYPVYLLALLLQLPFYRAAPATTAAVLLMVQSWTTLPSGFPGAWNSPAWTLSVEWFFYLIFPILLALLARVRRPRLWIGLAIVLILAIDGPQSGIAKTNWLVQHVPLPLLRVPEFFLGMLLGTLPPGERRHSYGYGFAVCFVTVLLLSVNVHRFVILVVIPFAALIWFLAGQESRLRNWLEVAPLVLLGQASYAVYILQVPIRNWVALWSRRGTLPSAQPLVYMVLLLMASLLTYAAVEQPARQWIRSLARAR
jgi:peptidoglycan/LPS O-acetylase OafA/YrhL